MFTQYWGHFIYYFFLSPGKMRIRCQQPAGSNLGVKARFSKNFNNPTGFWFLFWFTHGFWKDSQQNMNNWCFAQDADLSIVRSKNGVDSGRLPQRNEPQLWVRASEQHLLPFCVMREIINVQVGQCGNQIGYKVV